MKTDKLIRTSLNGTQYHIEYTAARVGGVNEYRVRRGQYGTWTRWMETHRLKSILTALGFNKDLPVAPVHDYAFEALFNKGLIPLNKAVITKIAKKAGSDSICMHLYSRLKQPNGETWCISASAVENKEVYSYLRKLIISCS